MRRSCAPSMRRAEKRRAEEPLPRAIINEEQTVKATSSNITKRLKGNKLVFNIQWREHSKKKNKTWKGNGVLEIKLDKNRAVLLDHTGKYIGGTNKLKISELMEGYQLHIGDKEVEILEQIDNQTDYWTTRKLLVDNRGWGTKEWEPPEEKKENKPRLVPFVTSSTIELNTQHHQKKQKSNSSTSTTLEKVRGNTNSERTLLPLTGSLAKQLRPHQWEGVTFVYERLTRSDPECEKVGCILADEMGLGKTLQVLTVANMLLREKVNRTVHRVLIVSPRSLIGNWNNEIYKWLHAERMYGFTVDGSSTTSNRKLSAYAKQQHVPFVIASYETLVSQVQDFKALNFDLLICDEGHRLKNADTKTYRTLCDLGIKLCILLTGTPVQNVLSEFYTLADFVNPGIFGSRSEFRQHFEIPIELGQAEAATEEQKCLAAERTEELKKISSTFMIRRLQNINLNYLPKKRDYICFLRPSKLQHLLLKRAISFYEAKKEKAFQDFSPLEMIAVLRKICNHPYLIKLTKKDNVLTRTLAHHMSDVKQINSADSTKLNFVENLLLKAVLEKDEKVVLVSYHTKTLNVLKEICDHHGLSHLRLDGSTTSSERNIIISKFNAEKVDGEEHANVLLLSAKAGGVGLNLVGASRLVLYDIDWNPANDAQALSRIWREGQTRDVHIYRLVTAGCIEEKIFQRQVAKTSLNDFLKPSNATKKVSSMKFSIEELQDLFYLQNDYDFSDTHQSLKCDCMGDGQNLFSLPEILDDTKQINELNQWKHWKPDFDESLMNDACLFEGCDDLIYLFTNEITK